MHACIGDRASSNKLNMLMTVQCIEIATCNVYIKSSVRYVTHNCSKYIRTSHFKSSANESLSPLIHAQLHRTGQHSEPKCAPLVFQCFIPDTHCVLIVSFLNPTTLWMYTWCTFTAGHALEI